MGDLRSCKHSYVLALISTGFVTEVLKGIYICLHGAGMSPTGCKIQG